MHYLEKLKRDVDKTHPNLGSLAVAEVLAAKARKMLIVIAPRGCGKSTISNWLYKNSNDALAPDRVTTAKLGAMEDELSNFTGTLIVDDIATGGTTYVMVHTICSLAMLCHDHHRRSYVKGAVYEIENFYGGIVANILPILLRDVIKHPLWEAAAVDKTMRYYHLYRPIKVNPDLPKAEVDWGIDLNRVKSPNLDNKLGKMLMDLTRIQWGQARTVIHTMDLLKSAAALDRRTEVNQSDYMFLLKLCQNFK